MRFFHGICTLGVEQEVPIAGQNLLPIQGLNHYKKIVWQGSASCRPQKRSLMDIDHFDVRPINVHGKGERPATLRTLLLLVFISNPILQIQRQGESRCHQIS